jgi:small subunit ribosomal protein S2
METMQDATSTTPIAMRQLLEAGVHFGHNTGRWNPKMKQYIFGARNGIHIIDLTHTVKLFKAAFNAVVEATSRGELVLFVGTKKQAQDVIVEEATRAGQLYVTQRWLGGTLTNFKTVKGSLERLKMLEKMEEDGTMLALTKREQIEVRRDREKLLKSLGGIKGMTKLPGMVFVIDPAKEHIAVDEARKLEIPVVGITDTNCDPDMIDYVIPGQRRRDPRHQAVHRPHRRRLRDRHQGPQGARPHPRRSRGPRRRARDPRVVGWRWPARRDGLGGRMYGDSEASASPDVPQ